MHLCHACTQNHPILFQEIQSTAVYFVLRVQRWLQIWWAEGGSSLFVPGFSGDREVKGEQGSFRMLMHSTKLIKQPAHCQHKSRPLLLHFLVLPNYVLIIFHFGMHGLSSPIQCNLSFLCGKQAGLDGSGAAPSPHCPGGDDVWNSVLCCTNRHSAPALSCPSGRQTRVGKLQPLKQQ